MGGRQGPVNARGATVQGIGGDKHYNGRMRKVLAMAIVFAGPGFTFAAGGWTPVGLTGGGGMFTPAISPHDANRMMVSCDMSDAFISRDGGENWTMIHFSQLRGNTRCRPVFHPREPETVFAADGWDGKLKVSRDGGKNWEALGDLPEGVGEVSVDEGNPSMMLAALRDGVVYSSADGGVHWTRGEGIKGRIYGMHIDQSSPVTSRVCIAGTSEGVFRSGDGGRTWSATPARGLPANLLRPEGEWVAGDFAPLGPSLTGGSNAKECVIYFAVATGVAEGVLEGGVFRSTDRGETWERAMGPGINLDTKAADQWSDGPFPRYHHVLTNNAAPWTVHVACTSSGYNPPHHSTVYRSPDGGRNWKAVWYGDPRWKEYNCEDDRTTASRGASYNETPLGLSISPKDPNVLMMTNMGQLFITRDGGGRWMASHCRRKDSSKPLTRDEEWRCNGLVVTTTWNYHVDPHDPARHYICYTDIGLARSTDSGKNWRWWGDDAGSPWRNTCYQLAFDPDTPGRMWGAFSDVHDIPNGNIIWGRHSPTGGGGVCLSEDWGVSWKPLKGLPVAPIVSVILDPTSPRKARGLWASSWENGVFRSDDGGKNWKKMSKGIGAPGKNMRVCRLIRHADGTLFVLVTAKRVEGKFLKEGPGLYRSKDGGKSWTRMTAGLSVLWPKDFAVDPKDSRVVYLGSADISGEEQAGLYRTADGGKSWTRILRKGSEHFGAVVNPANGWLYATLCEEAPESGLYLSRDGGTTWAEFKDIPFANIMRITFDPADKGMMYVTTFGGSVWHGPVEP